MATERQPTYKGNCHCGAFLYEVTLPQPLEQTKVVSDNCSICVRNGYLNIYPLLKDVKWLRGSLEELAAYRFGDINIAHRFCPTCGSSIGGVVEKVPDFFKGSAPKEPFMALNVRMLQDVDVSSLKVESSTQGKSFLPAYQNPE